MAFIANGRANLADGVDELDPEHPLGRGELDLAGKLVDVLDQGAEDDASALRRLGAHGVDHIGRKVRIELAGGRHGGGGGVSQDSMDLSRDGLVRLVEAVLGKSGEAGGAAEAPLNRETAAWRRQIERMRIRSDKYRSYMPTRWS